MWIEKCGWKKICLKNVLEKWHFWDNTKQGIKKCFESSPDQFFVLGFALPRNIIFHSYSLRPAQNSRHNFSKKFEILTYQSSVSRINLDKFNHSTGSVSMLYLPMKKSWCALICYSVKTVSLLIRRVWRSESSPSWKRSPTMFVQFSYTNSASVAVVAEKLISFSLLHQQPWICLQHQQVSTHIWRLSYLSKACHEKGKEDQLDKLCLEIQHQKLVSEYVLGQVNKYARWSASSTKALHHLQSPRLLEPTSLQLAIPSKSLKNYNKLLEVFCPFHYSSQETTGKPSTEPQRTNPKAKAVPLTQIISPCFCWTLGL